MVSSIGGSIHVRCICQVYTPDTCTYAHGPPVKTSYGASSLLQVWRLHRRIKFHVALTTIALLGNVLITVAGTLIVVNGGPFWLIVVSWIVRYVHIALDTLVLYIALETPVFHLESDCQDSGGVDVPPEVSLRC